MTDYYCDFGAGSNGSGTFASPYNTIDQAISKPLMTSADTIWFRRNVSQAIGLASYVNPNILPARLVGWPTSTDYLYSSRPVAAQSAWDGDAAVKVKLSRNITASSTYALFEVTTASTNVMVFNFQIEIERNFSNASPEYGPVLNYGTLSGITFEMRKVDITHKVTTNLNVNNQLHVIRHNTSANLIDMLMVDCTYYLKNTGGSIGAEAYVAFILNESSSTVNCQSANSRYINTYFKTDYGNGLFSSQSGSGLQIHSGYFSGCTWEWTTHTKLSSIALSSYNGYGTSNGILVIENCRMLSVSGGTFDNNGLDIVEDVRAGGAYRYTIIRNLSVEGFNRLNVYICGSQPSFNKLTITDSINVYGQAFTANQINCPILTLNNITDGTRDRLPTPVAIVKGINSSCVISRMQNCVVMLSGIDSDPTTYKKLDEYGTVNVAAPYRTGGEVFSVRLLATNSNRFGIAMLNSHQPGLDTIFAAASNGARTVTIYGYHKGFTTPTPTGENVAIEVDAITSLGTVMLKSRDFTSPTLTADGSTWNGISGGTAFRIAISFTATGDQNIAVRFLTSLVEAGGELYFDPKPVVT